MSRDFATLEFRLPDGRTRAVPVRYVMNGGYAGRNSEEVRHHIEELALLGIPAPERVPTLYPLAAHVVCQPTVVQVPHNRTSGEAEWALVVGETPEDLLLTAACDHTDRALEVHGVAWSKQAAVDALGDLAWPLKEIEDRLDGFTLRGWVNHNGKDVLIQDGTLAQLLPPSYWCARLAAEHRLKPGTVVLSGTIPMIKGVDQFGDGWRVEIADGAGNVSRVAYRMERLPAAWE